MRPQAPCELYSVLLNVVRYTFDRNKQELFLQSLHTKFNGHENLYSDRGQRNVLEETSAEHLSYI